MDVTSERTTSRLVSVLGLGARPVAALLILLLIADVALILLHLCLKIFGEPSGYAFDLGAERSYGEFMNYLKMLWSGAILLLLAYRDRAAVSAVWALGCAYMLGDDWFQFHERFGAFLAEASPMFGPLTAHVAELLWMLGAGVALGLLVLVAQRRSPQPAREVSIVLILLFVVLACFAIGLDAVHHIVFGGPEFDVPFTTLEDGGELLVMSVMTAFLFAVAFTDHRPRLGGPLGRIAQWPRAA